MTISKLNSSDLYKNLAQSVDALQKGSGESFEEVLISAQLITQTDSISKDLITKIQSIVKEKIPSFTQEEQLKWIRLINAYPSSITFDIANEIFRKAIGENEN